jgi:hypothetical protein
MYLDARAAFSSIFQADIGLEDARAVKAKVIGSAIDRARRAAASEPAGSFGLLAGNKAN